MTGTRNLRSIASLLVSLLFLSLFTMTGCSDDETTTTQPDFSTVPAAYDTAGAEKVVTDKNLVYYVLKDGSGPFEVVLRDRIEVHYTGRVKSTNEIFDSSYKNGSTEPEIFNLVSTIEGFRDGVLGMKIGGKRKIIVPPSLGYQSTSSDLYGDTLVYDIKLVDIL